MIKKPSKKKKLSFYLHYDVVLCVASSPLEFATFSFLLQKSYQIPKCQSRNLKLTATSSRISQHRHFKIQSHHLQIGEVNFNRLNWFRKSPPSYCKGNLSTGRHFSRLLSDSLTLRRLYFSKSSARLDLPLKSPSISSIGLR